MGEILDTMLAVQVLGAGTSEGLLKGNGLQAVVKRYLGIALDKTAQTSDWSGPLSDAQLRYAAIDAAILLPLADALDTALRSAGLARIATLEGDAMRALAWMEWDRTCLSMSRAGRRRPLRTASRRRRHSRPGRRWSVMMRGPARSPSIGTATPQVLRLLRAHGHAIARVDAPPLLPLKDRDPLIAALLVYREAMKRMSTYGHTWLHDACASSHGPGPCRLPRTRGTGGSD